MKGRKPDPAEVKKAKGNPGRRPIREVSTEDAPVLTSTAPEHLDENARKIWDLLMPDLTRMKFLRETDKVSFARYCQMAAQYWEAVEDTRVNGMTVLTESEHVTMRRRNPALDIQVKLAVRLEALEDRFGLTPMARHRIAQLLMTQPVAPPPGQLQLENEKRPGAATQQRGVVGFLQ